MEEGQCKITSIQAAHKPDRPLILRFWLAVWHDAAIGQNHFERDHRSSRLLSNRVLQLESLLQAHLAIGLASGTLISSESPQLSKSSRPIPS